MSWKKKHCSIVQYMYNLMSVLKFTLINGLRYVIEICLPPFLQLLWCSSALTAFLLACLLCCRPYLQYSLNRSEYFYINLHRAQWWWQCLWHYEAFTETCTCFEEHVMKFCFLLRYIWALLCNWFDCFCCDIVNWHKIILQCLFLSFMGKWQSNVLSTVCQACLIIANFL